MLFYIIISERWFVLHGDIDWSAKEWIFQVQTWCAWRDIKRVCRKPYSTVQYSTVQIRSRDQQICRWLSESKNERKTKKQRKKAKGERKEKVEKEMSQGNARQDVASSAVWGRVRAWLLKWLLVGFSTLLRFEFPSHSFNTNDKKRKLCD